MRTPVALFQKLRVLSRELLAKDSLSGVALALAGSCFVLLCCFSIQPAQFNDVGTLLSTEVSSAKEKKIPVLVTNLEHTTVKASAEEVREGLKMDSARSRAGINLFVRSGFLKAACQINHDPSAQDSPTRYAVMIDPNIERCAAQAFRDGTHSNDTELAQNLAFSAVAVEKFNRGTLHRQLENIYSKLVYSLAGHYPDLSLGPAQIKPSTIRQAHFRNPKIANEDYLSFQSEQEVAEQLFDECRALAAASFVMYDLLKQAKERCKNQDDEGEECIKTAAISAYGGHRKRTHAIIDYAPVVAAMSSMIEASVHCD